MNRYLCEERIFMKIILKLFIKLGNELLENCLRKKLWIDSYIIGRLTTFFWFEEKMKINVFKCNSSHFVKSFHISQYCTICVLDEGYSWESTIKTRYKSKPFSSCFFHKLLPTSYTNRCSLNANLNDVHPQFIERIRWDCLSYWRLVQRTFLLSKLIDTSMIQAISQVIVRISALLKNTICIPLDLLSTTNENLLSLPFLSH